MLWIAGSLSVVIGLYLGAIYWVRAAQAGQSPVKWGIGAALTFLATMSVLLALTSLLSAALGIPYFIQVWIACLLWFIATLMSGVKTDSIFARKLPVR